MRIQEDRILKIALILVLTLPDDGECPVLLISCGIIDLQNENNMTPARDPKQRRNIIFLKQHL